MVFYGDFYEEPQVVFAKKGWVRVCNGWGLPEHHEDEPALYFDQYFDSVGTGFMLLDWMYCEAMLAGEHIIVYGLYREEYDWSYPPTEFWILGDENE